MHCEPLAATSAITHWRIAPLLVLVLLIGACSGRKPDFQSPYGSKPIAPRLETQADLTALLRERASSHEKFWARGDLVITSEGKRGKDLVTVLLLYREPSDFRLRGSRAPIGTVFDLLLDDERALLHFTREDMGFFGTPMELREKLAMAGSLMPSDLLAALLAQQGLLEALEHAPQVGFLSKKESLLVAVRDPAGRQHLWNVRRSDGLIDEYMLRGPAGNTLIVATFDEYRMEPVRGREEPLPWRFRLKVPDAGATVAVNMDGYKIDPPLPAKAFEPPNPKELHPLRALEFSEP